MTEPASTRGSGIAAVVLAVTAFSWGFVIIKHIPLPPPVLAFWRLVLGAVVLTSTAYVLRVPWPTTKKWMLLAGIAFGAHQMIFIAAVKLTSIAIVTTLGAAQPLLVSLISRRTIGEAVRPAIIVCSVMAIGGVAVVMYANAGDASRSWEGDVLAVINLGVWTTYFMLAKKARVDGAPTLTFTAGFIAVAAVVVGPAMLVWTGAEVPVGVTWAWLALLVLGPGNGHLLLNWAHARISAALASLILALVPLLASLWAYLILDEPLTYMHGIGMALVVIAIDIGRRNE
jgi:drug/metabolite transporter (DMT)-like permease